MRARAIAHPNVALIKYWGKADPVLNIPAVGSLSLTLDGLATVTDVTFGDAMDGDDICLDGVRNPLAAKRISRLLDLLRARGGTGAHARVDTRNDFPTAAGLASSASGFAALVTAASSALDLDLEPAELEDYARLGSGSAPRSLYGGICLMELTGQDDYPTTCRTVSDAVRWPLEVVIAITEKSAKKIDSRTAMEACRVTSPYYESWVSSHPGDLAVAVTAIEHKDFGALATVSEHSCLKMHAAAMASRPGIAYWRPATVACMETVVGLRTAGTPVFFTIDAGPQVKAVCEPGATESVARALVSVPGVVDVRSCTLGRGAYLAGAGA